MKRLLAVALVALAAAGGTSANPLPDATQPNLTTVLVPQLLVPPAVPQHLSYDQLLRSGRRRGGPTGSLVGARRDQQGRVELRSEHGRIVLLRGARRALVDRPRAAHVPNKIVLPSAAIVMVAQTLVRRSVEWLASGLGASLFLFLAALAYPRGMGMGDVKLALLIGFGVGRTVPIALFIGMVAALVPSAVLFARHDAAA